MVFVKQSQSVSYCVLRVAYCDKEICKTKPIFKITKWTYVKEGGVFSQLAIRYTTGKKTVEEKAQENINEMTKEASQLMDDLASIPVERNPSR